VKSLQAELPQIVRWQDGGFAVLRTGEKRVMISRNTSAKSPIARLPRDLSRP
jgi:hypothetical protein